MKQGILFVCFVCSYEIHQTRVLGVTFLVFLENSQEGGVHWFGFIAFGLAV
jgi:hypothetical protein